MTHTKMYLSTITGISYDVNKITVNTSGDGDIHCTPSDGEPIEFISGTAKEVPLDLGINSFTISVNTETNDTLLSEAVITRKVDIVKPSDVSVVNSIALGEADGNTKYKKATKSSNNEDIDLTDAITQDTSNLTNTTYLFDPSKLNVTGEIIRVTKNDGTVFTCVYPGITTQTDRVDSVVLDFSAKDSSDNNKLSPDGGTLCTHFAEAENKNITGLAWGGEPGNYYGGGTTHYPQNSEYATNPSQQLLKMIDPHSSGLRDAIFMSGEHSISSMPLPYATDTTWKGIIWTRFNSNNDSNYNNDWPAERTLDTADAAITNKGEDRAENSKNAFENFINEMFSKAYQDSDGTTVAKSDLVIVERGLAPGFAGTTSTKLRSSFMVLKRSTVNECIGMSPAPYSGGSDNTSYVYFPSNYDSNLTLTQATIKKFGAAKNLTKESITPNTSDDPNDKSCFTLDASSFDDKIATINVSLSDGSSLVCKTPRITSVSTDAELNTLNAMVEIPANESSAETEAREAKTRERVQKYAKAKDDLKILFLSKSTAKIEAQTAKSQAETTLNNAAIGDREAAQTALDEAKQAETDAQEALKNMDLTNNNDIMTVIKDTIASISNEPEKLKEASFEVFENAFKVINNGQSEQNKVQKISFTTAQLGTFLTKKSIASAIKIDDDQERTISTSDNEAVICIMGVNSIVTLDGKVKIKKLADDQGKKKVEITRVADSTVSFDYVTINATDQSEIPASDTITTNDTTKTVIFDKTCNLRVDNQTYSIGSVTDVTPSKPSVPATTKQISLAYAHTGNTNVQPTKHCFELTYTDGQDYNFSQGVKLWKKQQKVRKVPIWVSTTDSTDEVTAAENPDSTVYKRKVTTVQQRNENRNNATGTGPNLAFGYYKWVSTTDSTDIIYIPIPYTDAGGDDYKNTANKALVNPNRTPAFFTTAQAATWGTHDASGTLLNTATTHGYEPVYTPAVSDTDTLKVWKLTGGTTEKLSATNPDDMLYEPVYESIIETRLQWASVSNTDSSFASSVFATTKPADTETVTWYEDHELPDSASGGPMGALDYSKALVLDNSTQRYNPQMKQTSAIFELHKKDDAEDKWVQMGAPAESGYTIVHKELRGMYEIDNFLAKKDGQEVAHIGVLKNGEEDINGSGWTELTAATQFSTNLCYTATTFDSTHTYSFDYRVTDTDGNVSDDSTYTFTLASVLEIQANNSVRLNKTTSKDTSTRLVTFENKFLDSTNTFRYEITHFHASLTGDERYTKLITEKISPTDLKTQLDTFITTLKDKGVTSDAENPTVTITKWGPSTDTGTIVISLTPSTMDGDHHPINSMDIKVLDFCVLGSEFDNKTLHISSGDETLTNLGIISVTGEETSGDDTNYKTYGIDLSKDAYRELAGASEDGASPAGIKELNVTFTTTDGSANNIKCHIIGTNSAPTASFSNLSIYDSETASDTTTYKLNTHNLNIFKISVTDNEDSEFNCIATVQYKENEGDDYANYADNATDKIFLFTTDGVVSDANLATVTHEIDKDDTNYLICNNLKAGFWIVTYTVTDAGSKSSIQTFNLEVTNGSKVTVEGTGIEKFFIKGTEAEADANFSITTTLDENRLPNNITATNVEENVTISDLVTISKNYFTNGEFGTGIECSVDTDNFHFLSPELKDTAAECLYFFVDITGFKDDANEADENELNESSDAAYSKSRRFVLKFEGTASGYNAHAGISEAAISLKRKDATRSKDNWTWTVDVSNMMNSVDKNTVISVEETPEIFQIERKDVLYNSTFTFFNTSSSSSSSSSSSTSSSTSSSSSSSPSSYSNGNYTDTFPVEYTDKITRLPEKIKKINTKDCRTCAMAGKLYILPTEFEGRGTEDDTRTTKVDIHYQDLSGMVYLCVAPKGKMAKEWNDSDTLDNAYMIEPNDISFKGIINMLYRMEAGPHELGIFIPNLSTLDNDDGVNMDVPTHIHITSLHVMNTIRPMATISKSGDNELTFKSNRVAINGNLEYIIQVPFANNYKTELKQTRLMRFHVPLISDISCKDHASTAPVELNMPVVDTHTLTLSDNCELINGKIYVKDGKLGLQKVFSKIARHGIFTIDCVYLNVKA